MNNMMNDTGGWMNGWMGGGMWFWTVIGVLVVVLLVVLIIKVSTDKTVKETAAALQIAVEANHFNFPQYPEGLPYFEAEQMPLSFLVVFFQ